ncbi:MAG: hypothetical protein P9X24_10555 [Candidatus Hatepunaea meridiana]|nr:hypothetical protein [Candidatus Hatepunaea meridiana]
MFDKDKPDFWREIHPGSTITLTDEQSISDSMERGEGIKGRDYIVESVWKIRQEDGFAEWLLFNLDDEDQEIWLVVKIVDQNVGIFVYYEPDEFAAGNRRDVIERGDLWLFNEPDDVDNFRFDELKFVREILWTVDIEDDGDVKEKEILYQLKGQGVLYGSCRHDPIQPGLERIMATVIEYDTSEDYENPELMILELGGEKGDEGGLISLMVGSNINMSEVEVLKSQKELPVERKKPSIWMKALKKLS